jgi:hypothetical protein
MSKLFAMAVPVLPNKKEQWLKFADDLNGRWEKEYRASRTRLKVRERAFYQSTPTGDVVIVTLEGEDPMNAFAKFGKGDDPFTQWFAKEVKEIHGFDLNNPPQVGLPELRIDSDAPVYHHI